MRVKARTGIVIGCVAGAIVGIGAVFAPNSESSSGLASMSAGGQILTIVDAPGRVARVLHVVNGRAFYTRTDAEGNECYGRGRLAGAAVEIGSEKCLIDPSGFPSTERPVLESLGVEVRKSDGRVTLWRLEGFAADGVATVELVRPSGTAIVRGAVTSNTFKLPVAGKGFADGVTLVARNGDGDVVYRHVYGPRQY